MYISEKSPRALLPQSPRGEALDYPFFVVQRQLRAPSRPRFCFYYRRKGFYVLFEARPYVAAS
jgi:hypothetical protein